MTGATVHGHGKDVVGLGGSHAPNSTPGEGHNGGPANMLRQVGGLASSE